MKKEKTNAWYKKNWADVWFSRFIRQRDKGHCYTCSNINDPKKMQCGHFNPRQYLSTRYDEINNHCQCYACNMLYGGQPATYAKNLIRDFGQGIVEKLESQRWVPVIGMDFRKIGDEYKKKYEDLLEQENVL